MTDDSGNAAPSPSSYEPYSHEVPSVDYHEIAANSNVTASPRVRLACEDALLLSKQHVVKKQYELLFTKEEYRHHIAEFLDEHAGTYFLIGIEKQSLPQSLECNSWIPDPTDPDNTRKGHHYYGIAMSEKDMQKVEPILHRFDLVKADNHIDVPPCKSDYDALSDHVAQSAIAKS